MDLTDIFSQIDVADRRYSTLKEAAGSTFDASRSTNTSINLL
jgi:hypothetical protein